MSRFWHAHTHSHYSALDAMATVPQIDPMGIGVLISRAGRGAANVNLPAIDEVSARRDRCSVHIPSPTVLVDEHVARRL